MPVHAHSGAADRRGYGEHLGIYVDRGRAGGRRGRCGSCIWSGVFERFPRPEVRRHRVRCVLGRRPAVDAGHRLRPRARGRRSSARSSTAQPHDAAERVLRPQLLHRRVEHPPPRARPALRDRRRQHHVGQRLPAPRGHLAAHPRVAAQRVLRLPVDETAAMLGVNAAEVYGFDVDALAPLVDRIGPTPDDLGQTGADLSKWAALAEAARPWITGKKPSKSPPATEPSPSQSFVFSFSASLSSARAKFRPRGQPCGRGWRRGHPPAGWRTAPNAGVRMSRRRAHSNPGLLTQRTGPEGGAALDDEGVGAHFSSPQQRAQPHRHTPGTERGRRANRGEA